MRIISKFHDYYDGVMSYSRSPIWSRLEKDLGEYKVECNKLKSMMYDFPFPTNYFNSYYSCDCVIVGFCGVLYPYYLLESRYPIMGHRFFTCKLPSDVVRVVKKEFKEDVKLEKSSWWRNYSFNDADFNSYSHSISKNNYDLFIKFGVPVFVIRGKENTITLNARLSDVNFQSFIDPWTAYQEIDRFLGNDLVIEPLKDFKMSDELMRDSKGFDKWSFKTKKKGG
jgi:hypothetical protein